jgi:hypothetical protein
VKDTFSAGVGGPLWILAESFAFPARVDHHHYRPNAAAAVWSQFQATAVK